MREQFPQWSDREIRAIQPGGWDNRSFRVGPDLVARLPSSAGYAAQVEKEHRWLPQLAARLPLEIPAPVARGSPGRGYPHPWSLYRWIPGEPAAAASPQVARELGNFLAALHRVDATGGPVPGPHNFHRGGSLRTYAGEVERALVILEGRVDDDAVRAAWQAGLASSWQGRPAWVHGDVAPGNLLLRSGKLAAVIDFGNLAAGDPACDLAVAWTWLDDESARALRTVLPLDDEAWLRGRAWALWKALVVAAGLSPTAAREYSDPLAVIRRCLASDFP